MTAWWEQAPLADQQQDGGDWWKAAPLAGEQAQADAPAPAAAAPASRFTQELRSGPSPSLSDRLTDMTGWNPQYWRNVVHNAKAPARAYEAALEPAKGIAQAVPNALAFITSAAGYAPNAVSRAIGGAADTTNEAINEEDARRRTERAAAGYDPDGVDPARMVGFAASPFNLAIAARAGTSTNVLGNLWRGGLSGAAMEAAQPAVTRDGGSYGGKKAEQAATGGVLGGGTSAVVSGAGKLAGPWATEAAQRLYNMGVRKMTIGQAAGPSVRSWENKATSIPLTGDAIMSAQHAATEDFNRTAINRALAPIGEELPADIPVGRPGVEYMQRAIGKVYDDTLSRISGLPDRKLANDVSDVVFGPNGMMLPPRERTQLDNIVKGELSEKMQAATQSGRVWDGRVIQDIDSRLSNEIRNFGRSQDPNQRNLADRLSDIQDAFRDWMARNASPEDMARLAQAREAFANEVRIDKAASGVGSNNGVFSPAQLSNAVRSADSSVRHKRFASGAALMQDLSDTAMEVLPRNVPDSGTPGRGLFAAGVTGLLAPNVLAGMLGGAALYTSPAQAAARKLMLGGNQVRNAIAGGMSEIARFAPNAMLAVPEYMRPYDATPKTQREWNEEYSRRKQAAQGMRP